QLLAEEGGFAPPSCERIRVVIDPGHGLERTDRASFREITLLDPNWLTNAIYTVLNSRDVLDRGGELTRAELVDLLDPVEYPPERHEFILDMMQDPQIGLAFRLSSDDERFLVPEALQESAPPVSSWPDDVLRFRYRYDNLPRSLIPRLIVLAHKKLVADCRWRTGAYFALHDCQAYVRADRANDVVDIAVAGPANRRRDALQVLIAAFDDVHDWQGDVGAEPRVPLPDEPDLDVGYDHLRRLEDRYGGDHAFDPEGAERSYTVAELLNGVRHERRPVNEHEAPPPQPAPAVSAPEPPRGPNIVSAALTAGAAMVVAMVVMLGLRWLPANWFPVAGVVAAAGACAFLASLWFQRPLFERLLLGWFALGLGAQTASISFDAGYADETTAAAFALGGPPTIAAYVVWLVVFVFLGVQVVRERASGPAAG
ncbi:MAG: COR domain-containing protein, partial [Pseudomonadota bacterium]